MLCIYINIYIYHYIYITIYIFPKKQNNIKPVSLLLHVLSGCFCHHAAQQGLLPLTNSGCCGASNEFCFAPLMRSVALALPSSALVFPAL